VPCQKKVSTSGPMREREPETDMWTQLGFKFSLFSPAP
jgi:hypothetical protein